MTVVPQCRMVQVVVQKRGAQFPQSLLASCSQQKVHKLLIQLDVHQPHRVAKSQVRRRSQWLILLSGLNRPWAQVGGVQGPPMAQQHLSASQVKKRASKNQSKSKPTRGPCSSCSCTIFPEPLSQCKGTSLLKRMAPKLISPRNAVEKPGSARGGYQAASNCKASTKAGRANHQGSQDHHRQGAARRWTDPPPKFPQNFNCWTSPSCDTHENPV